jgi:DNA invertase Pin-like site-specific DNA recombinase
MPPETKTATATAYFPLRSVKMQDQHLAKLVIVYVRQSSPYQVLEHRESRERPYALADLAVALGWSRERVLVIDEDQGQSGKTAADRAGFQRLVAEVTMGHVGLILGLEVSRLARSNTDWHHLFELCALFQTLLADQEGVYDANDSNDRLILGLKGMMSEVELTTMRNRLERGKWNKAERGELFTVVPLGYVRLGPAEVALDPDEQVQSMVRLVFAKFTELGSVFGVFRYLLSHQLCLGMRARTGPHRGQVQWRRPALPTLFAMLHNPMYAGVYVFGRRGREPRPPGTAGTRCLPSAPWQVQLRDRLPAYISWEQYLENQVRIQQNCLSDHSSGSPRSGAALLSGVLVCGTCNTRMRTTYGNRGQAYYNCVRYQQRGTERTCHGVQAQPVDELVAAQVLEALTPAALELSQKAVSDIQKEWERLERHWHQRLERARYEAERAQRQYQAVEPENRLVARTLEKAWEEALQAEAQLQEEHDRFVRTGPQPLSAAARERVRALASDIPALWHAATPTAKDRKEIVRCLIERVQVHVRPDSQRVAVTIHWQGGFTTQHEVQRAVRCFEDLDDFERLLERIGEWRRQGQSAPTMARLLNLEGYRTPKKRGPFTADTIRKLLTQHQLIQGKAGAEQLQPQEWWLTDLARQLQIPPAQLRAWVKRRWLQGRQLCEGGPWVVWADAEEIKRLKKLRRQSQRGHQGYDQGLIIPKKRRR